MTRSIHYLNEQISLIEKSYETHFKTPFPERIIGIIGWWDPRFVEMDPLELEKGVARML